MNREAFERISREALTEVLDELNYPKAMRHRLCGLSVDPPPLDRDEMEYCIQFADRREGYFRFCLPRSLSDEAAKAEIKRRLLEHGVVPGVDYVIPTE
jgi:hypothetical protein